MWKDREPYREAKLGCMTWVERRPITALSEKSPQASCKSTSTPQGPLYLAFTVTPGLSGFMS